jgi:hypothetical protein
MYYVKKFFICYENLTFKSRFKENTINKIRLIDMNFFSTDF